MDLKDLSSKSLDYLKLVKNKYFSIFKFFVFFCIIVLKQLYLLKRTLPLRKKKEEFFIKNMKK